MSRDSAGGAPADDQDQEAGVTERRGVLQILGGALLGALALALAVPAGLVLTFPTRRRTVSGGEEAVDLGPLDRLPEGQPSRVSVVARRRRDAWSARREVTLGAVWLIRQGTRVKALSSVCPHTGCAVDWEDEQERFVCPCHRSAFARDGARLAGPAPRGMDALEAEVREGRVRLSYRRFRPGVPRREPV